MTLVAHISPKLFRMVFAVVILVFGCKAALGNTIVLPDTNFRNVLLANYPSVMSGNNLDIAAANSFPYDLFLNNANISDLTGIEYFTSVFKIDASANNLTTLPDLSGNTNLKYLYLNYNKLSDVGFLVNNTNLHQIQLFNNQLTHFPALPGFTQLQQLFLSNNKISTIDDVSSLVNLLDLQIGNNLLDSLPDLSKNTNLLSLHFHKNKIKDVSDLMYLPKLETVYCWSNEIADLSAINNNTTLKTLVAFDNNLKELPILSNKAGLNTLEIAKNQLTFQDLLPLVELPLTTFSYAPQDSVGVTVTDSVRALNELFMEFKEDPNVLTNTYIWYKNGMQISSSVAKSLFISALSLSDSGTYTVQVTNSNLPLLTIHHKPWKISVLLCMDLISYGYKILSKDCNNGTELQAEVLLEGAKPPLTYVLKSLSGKDSVYNASDIIADIPAGEYKLEVIDQRNCKILADPELTIYNPSGCNPVLTPLNGSQESTYFIEGKGEVRIIDMKGKVIRTLSAPAVWDGTTSEGNLADAGYYVITLNNKKLTNISVLR